MSLISHIEEHVGVIDKGWIPDEGADYKIGISVIQNSPFEGASTYITTGLSDYPLEMPDGRIITQELLFSTYSNYNEKEAASLLLTFAENVAKRGAALLKGDTVGPYKPVISSVKANALYFSLPVFWDDDFFELKTEGYPVVFVSLIPILGEEVDFIHGHSSDEFEDLLVEKDPDLFDLNRLPVI